MPDHPQEVFLPQSCVACRRRRFGRAWTQRCRSGASNVHVSLRLLCFFEKRGQRKSKRLCVLAWGRCEETEGVSRLVCDRLLLRKGELGGRCCRAVSLIVVAVRGIGGTVHQCAQKFSAFYRFQAALQLLLFSDAFSRNQQDSVCE